MLEQNKPDSRTELKGFQKRINRILVKTGSNEKNNKNENKQNSLNRKKNWISSFNKKKCL